jgi:EmrB/QacA subfamily drug resistance transporter
MATAAQTEFQTSGLVRLSKSQLIGTLGGLLFALLLAAIDQTIVGTAEPRIIASLSGFNRYPWVATAYLLSSTIAVPIFGKLSDIYGRKGFFLFGTSLFVIASALCGASGTLNFLPFDGMNQLILFRGIQGLGAGMMIGLIFVIIGDIFSPAERGKYQALFAAVWGFASMFGPTAGGWLTDTFSWRATFYVNLPVGIIAVIAIWLQFPNFHNKGVDRKIDTWGVATLVLCIVPLLLALTWVTNYGWSSTRVESLLAWAILMLFGFLYAESKAKEPLIPLTLFRNPVISTCSLAVFILGMGMFGVIIYLPLFMQGVLGVSATQSGNLLTPLMMGAVAGSIVTGQMNARIGSYKIPAVLGSILVAIGMILFARMDGNTLRSYVVMGMIIAGIGMGLLQPVYTVAVQNSAPREHMGAATASTAFFRSIGSTVGVAVFGSLLLTKFHEDFDKGIPPGTPARALEYFKNPLMLGPMRSQLEAGFGQYPGGLQLLHALMANVRNALIHGLNRIFLSSAVIMSLAVILHILLKDVKLRGRAADVVDTPPAH